MVVPIAVLWEWSECLPWCYPVRRIWSRNVVFCIQDGVLAGRASACDADVCLYAGGGVGRQRVTPHGGSAGRVSNRAVLEKNYPREDSNL